ncbi:MAG: hypothetical protein PHP37_03560 [Patescibacteria group bacterium]|nr:hypothetical protein [Patescibacteria group bacterium]
MDNYGSESKPLSDIDNRVFNSLTVISKGEVEAIWGKNCPGEGENLFPKDFIKEIKGDPGNDYLIIYLSGKSIHEQMKIAAQKGINIRATNIHLEETQKRGKSGYYLIKLRRYKMSYVTDDNKIENPPPFWRRAKLREASEIILNILFVLGERVYQRDWHICNNYKRKDYANIVRFSMNKRNELIMSNRKIKEAPININSITVRKLS